MGLDRTAPVGSETRHFRFTDRKPISNYPALNGIRFVLSAGIPWMTLSTKQGRGHSMACWQRLRERTQTGVWPMFFCLLLS